MSRSIGDRDAEDVVGDRNEVVEVAADDLRRHRLSPDVETLVLRYALRKNRFLDALGFDDQRFVPLGAQALVDRVSHEVEREEDVVSAQFRRNVEAEDVLVVVAGGNGCETLRPETLLELAVDARIIAIHDDHAVPERQLERFVMLRNRDGERAILRGAESCHQLVSVLAGVLVNAPAGDAEPLAKLGPAT